MTPNFDHTLCHSAQFRATGANIHTVNNLLTQYNLFWFLGKKKNWPEEIRKDFETSERKLRGILNKGQLCTLAN
jgi:hypothetical protein